MEWTCTLNTSEVVSLHGDFLFGGGYDRLETGLFLLGKSDVGCANFRTLDMCRSERVLGNEAWVAYGVT